MILFFDTETTGKADFRYPLGATHQPRIIQLAAILTDNEGREESAINLIIKPNGYNIPETAESIHGISTKKATEWGVNAEVAYPLIRELVMKPRIIVAHNIEFDIFMVRSEILRAGFEDDPFEGANQVCTMLNMTDVCCIPGPYGNKWPNLSEAYSHCFGKDFDGAHDALADVRACMAIYFWLQKRNEDPPISSRQP